MSDIDLNEDIHQYPIKSKYEVGIRKTEHQLSERDITVVFPIHNPQADEMNNLRFIIHKLLPFNIKLMVVEQVKDQYSYLLKFLENIIIEKKLNSKHLLLELYISQEEVFSKEEAINWAIKNKVKTKYVLINDPNFYQDFDSVLKKIFELYAPKFVSTYSFEKNLTQEFTNNLISTKNFSVDEIPYSFAKLFSRSLFLNKKAFLEMGGLSNGDTEYSRLLTKAHELGKKVDIIEGVGIYLYNGPKLAIHPRMEFENNKFERDMAIIVCHFNWCKYINPTRNLNRFLRQMEMDDLPVYGVELSLNDKFETKNKKNWINIKVNYQNVCFQKEACINLVEKHIPEKYKKIAWIDPDLHFTNKNWYRETSEKLNTHKLVQMYSEGYGTDRYGRVSRRHPSIMAMYGKVPMDYWFRHPGHPGGAWGAHRDFWKNGGLYPYCIMGGGDTVFIYTIFGYTFLNEVYSLLGICGDNIFEPYAKWRNKIKNYITPKDITYINNAFIHEWHGDSINRNYNLRHNIAKSIDMTKNVQLNSQGIIELYDIKKKSIYDGILGYFKGRDEDGIIGDMDAYINFKNELNQQNE